MVEAVLAGDTIRAVAQGGRIDRKTVRKWVNRYRAEGAMGLGDRSSRPRHSPKAIARGTAQRVITLRRRRWTMASIAAELKVSRATASRVLARLA
jgi:transposase